MRFVLAIVLFIGALASAGYGIAQRTVLAGPDQLVAAGGVASEAPITIIDGGTLSSFDGSQSLTVRGDGTVFAAYGRTADVLGWVGESSYNEVTVDPETRELSTDVVRGSDDAVPDPAGSDLWLEEQTGEGRLFWSLDLTDEYTVLLMTQAPAIDPASAPPVDPNAEATAAPVPAPGDVSIRWPVDNSAPWSSTLIIGGIGLLILGLICFIWALVHARRRRGPRRKPPRLPRAPRPPQLTSRRLRALPAVPDRSGRRRGFVVLPGLVVGALVLSGCTSGPGPLSELFGDTPTPTPSASAAEDAGAPVAVLRGQLTRILSESAATVAEADAALDPAIAERRLTGPALQQRLASYTIRKADGNQAAEPPIPVGKVSLALPQRNEGWPRTVFAVTSNPDDATIAPMALMLIQESPREQYKITYAVPLEPNAVVPDLAPASVGADRLRPDFKNLKLPPEEIVNAYASILVQGDQSPSAELFEAEGDGLRAQLGVDYKAQRKASLPASAAIEFSQVPGKGETIVFGTNDTGAIVAVNLDDIETVRPTEAGASINPDGKVKLLSGTTTTGKGIIATYGLQMLFYVPPALDESAKIELLGFTQGLVSATEVP